MNLLFPAGPDRSDSMAASRVADPPPAVREQLPVPIQVLPDETWRRYWYELPCWLTSLVVHLTVLVTLGLLLVPVSQERPIQLLVALSPVLHQPPTSPPVIELVAHEPDESEQESAAPPRDEAPSDTTNPPHGLDVSQMLQRSAELGRQLAALLPQGVMASAVASEAPATAPADTSERRSGEQVEDAWLPSEEEPGRHDEIVDRFIQYDIGRLRGRAGLEAREDFRRLGLEAIPALVRGLNKSAYYRQSCPVAVISSKLTYELGRSNDREMLRYALRNLGRGVPGDAPHAQRVRDVSRKLLAMLPQDERRGMWAERNRPVEPPVSKPSSANLIESLAERLESGSVEERVAAARTLVARSRGLTGSQRLSFANQILVHLPQSAGDERIAYQQALVELAGLQSPLAPETAEEWEDYWIGQKREYAERLAQSQFQMARQLELAGQRQQAEQRYRRLVEENSQTRGASMARERLQQM